MIRNIYSSACLLLVMGITILIAHSPAAALDQRTYPNQGRSVQISLSSSWFLLDAPSLERQALDRFVDDHFKRARVKRVEPLLADRIAIQLEGLDDSAAADVARRLTRSSRILRAWPAYERFSGVGFFDDQLLISSESRPTSKVLRSAGVRLIGPSRVPGIWRAQATDGDAIAAAWALTRHIGIRWAEPDLIRHVETYETTNDPQLQEQWHLEATDGVGDINVSQAWDITFGNPAITIAIFDNGVDMDHPDLAPNIVGGFDAVDGDTNPEAECIQSFDGASPAASCPENRPFRASHGTAVAGISAARGDNKILGSGVCPMCTLYPVRLLSGGGVRTITTAGAFMDAAQNGSAIINNSWGPQLTRFFPLATAEKEVLDEITTTGRDGLGVVVVFAAGNDYFTPAGANPYASHPQVITVSASTKQDDFACYSNYGRVISVSAPSKGCNNREPGLRTTDYVGREGYSGSDFAQDFGGTSAASPVAAGLAGLILSANPDLTAQQVRLIMQATAERIVADKNDWLQMVGVDLADVFRYDKNGFSRGFGYGRIDAGRAVALALDPPSVGGLCSKECGACIAGRCAPLCQGDRDCPASSQCTFIGPDVRACVMTTPAASQDGQPCSSDCELCVEAPDTNILRTSVCSSFCTSDEDCRFGFDCRSIDEDGSKACIPGNQECGAPWGTVRCQSDVVVESKGEQYCSCECVPGTQAACPDGFLCKNVTCRRSRGTVLCQEAENNFSANYTPQCLPDPNIQRACSGHRDCSGGLFCIEGVCAADRGPGGCDVCTACEADADCIDGETCVDTRRGKRCLPSCEVGLNAMCPADSVCTNIPGPAGYHCVNPDYDRKGICPRAYRCEQDGRCFNEDDCDGVSCTNNVCGDASEDASTPDAASEATDGGVADADPLPDRGIVLLNSEAPRDAGGCTSSPSHSPLGYCLIGLVALCRLRRRR